MSAIGINSKNQVTGNLINTNGTIVGFIWQKNRAAEIFNPSESFEVKPMSINDAGTVVGYYFGPVGSCKGFIRLPNSTIITFGIPHQTVMPIDINNRGQIAGILTDPVSGITHGFLRETSGKVSIFDPPTSFQTSVDDINDAGIIVGSYFNSTDSKRYGFKRLSNGTIISFPHDLCEFNYVRGVNNKGQVTGCCIQLAGPQHGYIMQPNGTITIFDPPASVSTDPWTINDNGVIAGMYQTRDREHGHGFIRWSNGTIISFDYAREGMTIPHSINLIGCIAGTYETADRQVSSFLFTI